MIKRVSIAGCAALICAWQAYGAAVLVEAERFADHGGWVADSQFIDEMGSTYLLAHGLGHAVADAETTVRLPERGVYHVYARTYNWTSPWSAEPGPGRFRVVVDGEELPAVLGDSGNRWEWQYAGSVEAGGEVSLALRDLAGLDGRVDALYLTTDSADVRMPGSRQAACAAAEDGGTYDLVVVGGGIAGMHAAVAAARLGCRVALAHNRPVLGGNNSSEVRVHLGGCLDVGRYPRLGAMLKEYGPTREGNAMPTEYYGDDDKAAWIAAEPNVTLFLNTHVNSVETDSASGRIKGVTGVDALTGRRVRLEAPLFCDCTGDGTVGYLAGADYRMGRESRDEFGEPSAPEVGDAMTMGASVQWRTRAAGEGGGVFPEFDYGMNFTDSTCHRVDRGEWTWETGMYSDQLNAFERVRDYGMLVVYANWSYLVNRLGLFPDRELDWVAYVGGKRESRRLLGDYILKEDDLVKRVWHEDGTFATSWSIDLHFPDPENSRQFPQGSFIASNGHVFIHPYEVPFRCLYSRNVDNLMMAGRDISCTHVALGTVRVMRTTAMMGEVCGMAAWLCREHGVTPRGVYQRHLPELKGLMAEGVARGELPDTQRYNEGTHLTDD